MRQEQRCGLVSVSWQRLEGFRVARRRRSQTLSSPTCNSWLVPCFGPTAKPIPVPLYLRKRQLSSAPEASDCEGVWTFVWTRPLETEQWKSQPLERIGRGERI